MKNHLRLVTSKGDPVKPQRFNRERLSAYAKVTPGEFAPFVRLPLRVLRYVLYMVLLFVRIPVQIVCRLTIVPLLLFALVWGFLKGWTSTPTLLMAGSAFVLFVLSFLYDTLLIVIAPEPIYLDT